MCVRVCSLIHVSPSQSVPDYILNISYSFFTNDFQTFRYGDHGQDVELINFLWPWLNYQGHRGHYVSKLTVFTRYFLQLSVKGFKILRYGDHGQDLELFNCLWLWLNFQCHRGSLCFKIYFVYPIFPIALYWYIYICWKYIIRLPFCLV